MQELAEILRVFRRLLLPCPWTDPALAVIERSTGAPRVITLEGSAGTGKSSLLRRILLATPPRRQAGNWLRQVALVPVPSHLDIAELGRSILSSLDDPVGLRDMAPFDGILQRLRTQISQQGVRTLMFDDAHHLLQCRRSSRASVLQLLAGALSDAPLDVVFCGVDPGLSVLRNCLTELGRPTEDLILVNCPWDGDQGSEDWSVFLNQVSAFLPFSVGVALGSDDIAFRLHAATDGNLGRLFRLLSHAIVIGKREGASSLGVEHLALAWRQLACTGAIDPFRGAGVLRPLLCRQPTGTVHAAKAPSTGRGLPVLPVPYADESPLGYLARAAEANGYDGPDRILEVVGLRGRSFAKLCEGDWRRLAELFGERSPELMQLAYLPVGSGRVRFLGQSMASHHLTIGWQWVCPACLREAAYHRALWDASFISACPIHGILLLHACPGCGRDLAWSRSRAFHCPTCERNLADAHGELPMPVEHRAATRLVAARWLGDADACLDLRGALGLPNELIGAPAAAMTEILLRFAHFEQLAAPRSVRDLNATISTFHGWPRMEAHRRLAAGTLWFEHWPKAFHERLDVFTSRTNLDHSTLSGTFGAAFSAMSRWCGADDYRFLIEEFVTHIKARPVSACIRPKVRLFAGRSLSGAAYVPVNEAVKRLNIHYHAVQRFIDAGLLQCVSFRCGSGNVSAVSASSLRKVEGAVQLALSSKDRPASGEASPCKPRQRRQLKVLLRHLTGTSLTVSQAYPVLGVSKPNVRALAQAGLLAPENPDAPPNRWRFSPSQLKEMVRRLSARVTGMAPRRAVSLKGMSKMAWQADCDFIGTVRLVLEGTIRPCMINPQKNGFAALIFDYQEARQFFQRQKALALRGITARDATVRLGLREEVIYDLINAGLLKPQVGQRKGGIVSLIPEAAIQAFKAEYVAGWELVDGSSYRLQALIQSLKSFGVFAVTGPTVDGRSKTFFRAADLAHVPLSRLVRDVFNADKARRQGKC